jgi:hypothetical protein
MSNIRQIKTKHITIELDKERSLCYDLNAYSELELQYGSVEKALEALSKGSIIAVRFVLWAGFIHEESNDDGTYNITPAQIGRLIDGPSLPIIMDAINEAMNDSAPDAEVIEGQQSGN